METWVCAGWVLCSNGNMNVCWGVLSSYGNMGVLGWALSSNGDMGVCCVEAEQQWTHGCLLGGG